MLTNLQLFLGRHGPEAGKEERFPGPDNHSKIRRSVKNAEHVGLYSPVPKRATTPHPRRTGKLNLPKLRNGCYLAPARASIPDPLDKQAPFLVDVNSPYDSFAGSKPCPFP